MIYTTYLFHGELRDGRFYCFTYQIWLRSQLVYTRQSWEYSGDNLGTFFFEMCNSYNIEHNRL